MDGSGRNGMRNGKNKSGNKWMPWWVSVQKLYQVSGPVGRRGAQAPSRHRYTLYKAQSSGHSKCPLIYLEDSIWLYAL